jgi:hypothetical protein
MEGLILKLENPSKIFDRRLFIYSVQVSLFAVLGIIILGASYKINSLGFV